jgi:antitoxin VapB
MQTTRIFTNGNSQALRLPKAFRFASSEVFIRKDMATGDVVLSARAPSGTWADFFALRAKTRVPGDFLADRPLNAIEPARDPFAGARMVKPPRRK